MLKNNKIMIYSKKCDSDNGVVLCRKNGYIPKPVIDHVKSKKYCIYHFTIHHYLSLLYYDDQDDIQHYVSNTFLRISYPHSQYEEFTN